MPFDDQIKLMLRQAELAEHEATEIVFHPTDWADLSKVRVDHQALLKKYIAYVGDMEGTDFINADPSDYYMGDFSPEEKAELLRLSETDSNT